MSLGAFYIFFQILIFGVNSEVKGQIMAQNDKRNSVCHAFYLKNHTSYDLHLWYACVKG